MLRQRRFHGIAHFLRHLKRRVAYIVGGAKIFEGFNFGHHYIVRTLPGGCVHQHHGVLDVLESGRNVVDEAHAHELLGHPLVLGCNPPGEQRISSFTHDCPRLSHGGLHRFGMEVVRLDDLGEGHGMETGNESVTCDPFEPNWLNQISKRMQRLFSDSGP